MSRTKALFLLHLIVIIFGFTGILGKEISLGSVPLVWHRMLIAAASLAVYFVIIGKSFRLKNKNLLQYMGVGLIIAAHWITFFEAIKQSNVSVTLATMASTSLFVAFIEPLVYRKRIVPYELGLGVLVIIGLVMIFSFEIEYKLGIILALISASLAALFGTLNSVLIKDGDSLRISLYELGAGVLGVSIYMAFTGGIGASLFEMSLRDLILLLILGTVATAFAFVISVEVMKELSPFTVALTINLEPVYSILLALLIYKEEEQMTAGFYAGALLILATIFINSLLKDRSKKKKAERIIRQ